MPEDEGQAQSGHGRVEGSAGFQGIQAARWEELNLTQPAHLSCSRLTPTPSCRSCCCQEQGWRFAAAPACRRRSWQAAGPPPLPLLPLPRRHAAALPAVAQWRPPAGPAAPSSCCWPTCSHPCRRHHLPLVPPPPPPPLLLAATSPLLPPLPACWLPLPRRAARRLALQQTASTGSVAAAPAAPAGQPAPDGRRRREPPRWTARPSAGGRR